MDTLDAPPSTLTCTDIPLYPKILNGCIYVVKYGLCSPEIFLRRVHKRQSKKLRKKGINLSTPGYEYAIAENILFNLKSLTTPLIPHHLYQKLRSILDIEQEEGKFNYIAEVFQDVNEKQLYVIQVLLKTMYLLGTFQSEWNCSYCGKGNAGNDISVSMIALPVTSYIMREKPLSGEGHWFLSWGQQASDIEVVKALVRNWEAVSWSFVELRNVQLHLVKQWYCSFYHELHGSDEPDEVQPLAEVMPSLANKVEFVHQPGDFQLIFGRFNSSSPVEQFPISIPPPLPPPAILTPDILTVSPTNLTPSPTILTPSILSPPLTNLTPITPSLPSLPVSPAPLDLDPQPSLIDYTHPLSYITSLQTQNIKLQPIDLTPKVVDPLMESSDADELISSLISNIFSGCDNESGGYDMWADFTPNDKENKHNFGSVKSTSFFTSAESPSVPQSEGGGRIRRKRLIKSVLSAMNKIVYKYNTKDSCPDPEPDSFVSADELNNRNTDLKSLLDRLNKNSGKLGSWQIEKPESHEDNMVKYFGQDFDNCTSYLPQYEPAKYDPFEFESAVKEPTKDLDYPELKSYQEIDYAKDFPKSDLPDYPKINDVKPLDYSKILKRKLDNYSTARTLDTQETPQTSPIIPVSEVLQFPPYNFPPLEPTRAASPFPVPQPVAAPPIPQWLIHTTPPNLTTVMRMTNSNIGSNTVNTSSYSSTNLNFGYNYNCWKNSPPPPGLDLEGPDPVWMNWLSKPNTVISPTNRWDASISMSSIS